VTVPRMYQELCTPKVLTMEWIQGTKVSLALYREVSRPHTFHTLVTGDIYSG
jgi:predicted unusual protein kinase regulating ubiquinone biosynthesis (AarF/ABC1/UbiB family)